MQNLSLVIPVHNEAENILKLATEIDDSFLSVAFSWEVIWVNDCSTDNTKDILNSLTNQNPRHSVLHLAQQSGQSAAVLSGINKATFKLIGTLDGDGQNAPGDLIHLKSLLELHELNLAQGVRVKRMDPGMRRASTSLANIIRNSILGIELNDVGCAVRVFHKDAIFGFPAFKGWHRFLPVMMSLTTPNKVKEHPVSHRPRIAGYSKYGVMNRLWVGIFDIFGVLWLKKRGFTIQEITISHE